MPKFTERLPSKPNPIDIVNCCRDAYRNFMKATQKISSGTVLKVSAHSDGQGFEEGTIVVTAKKPGHEDVWATNVITNPNDSLTGFIFVNPDLLNAPASLRKFVLAHEWIEVMLAFAWEGASPYHQSLLQNHKIDMAIMFSAIGQRAFWQDSNDELLLMNVALRRLLVSKESLEKMILDHQSVFEPIQNLESWAGLCATDPETARNLIVLMSTIFSHTKNVRSETVEERIQEILISGLRE